MTIELQQIEKRTGISPGNLEHRPGSSGRFSPYIARPLSLTGYGHALAFAGSEISGRRVYRGYVPVAVTAAHGAGTFSGKGRTEARIAEINRTKGFTAG